MNEILSNIAIFAFVMSTIISATSLLYLIIFALHVRSNPFTSERMVIGWIPIVAFAYMITYIIVKN